MNDKSFFIYCIIMVFIYLFAFTLGSGASSLWLWAVIAAFVVSLVYICRTLPINAKKALSVVFIFLMTIGFVALGSFVDKVETLQVTGEVREIRAYLDENYIPLLKNLSEAELSEELTDKKTDLLQRMIDNDEILKNYGHRIKVERFSSSEIEFLYKGRIVNTSTDEIILKSRS